MIKCSECGYENMDGLDYCDGCGAKLAAAGAAASSPPSSTAAGPSPSPSAEPAEVSETAAGAPAETAGVDALASSTAATQAEPEEPAKTPTGEMNAAGAAAVPSGEVSAAAAPFKAKLAVIRGGRRGQEFELENGNNLVGRWDPETGAFPEVDLDADDPEAKISRKHALIRIDAGRLTIEDIGSLNGTYVNRQPRLQPGNPVDLKDGDEIIIGKTFLKLSINPIS